MKRISAITALFLALNLSLFGQFKPADPQQQSQRPPLAPQSESANGQPHFAVKVNLVRLLVTVRDPAGALVTNLRKDDFRVLDDGIPQEIALFEQNTSVPLSVAVLLDTSASVQMDLHYEADSVLRFLS